MWGKAHITHTHKLPSKPPPTKKNHLLWSLHTSFSTAASLSSPHHTNRWKDGVNQVCPTVEKSVSEIHAVGECRRKLPIQGEALNPVLWTEGCHLPYWHEILEHARTDSHAVYTFIRPSQWVNSHSAYATVTNPEKFGPVTACIIACASAAPLSIWLQVWLDAGLQNVRPIHESLLHTRVTLLCERGSWMQEGICWASKRCGASQGQTQTVDGSQRWTMISHNAPFPTW